MKILSHGWMDNINSRWYAPLTSQYLIKGNANVIAMDWSKYANGGYLSAVNAVPAIGDDVATTIVSLSETFNIPLSKFHLIGHSLGAHIFGFTGEVLACKRTGVQCSEFDYFVNDCNVTQCTKFGQVLMDKNTVWFHSHRITRTLELICFFPCTKFHSCYREYLYHHLSQIFNNLNFSVTCNGKPVNSDSVKGFLRWVINKSTSQSLKLRILLAIAIEISRWLLTKLLHSYTFDWDIKARHEVDLETNNSLLLYLLTKLFVVKDTLMSNKI